MATKFETVVDVKNHQEVQLIYKSQSKGNICLDEMNQYHLTNLVRKMVLQDYEPEWLIQITQTLEKE